MFRWAGTSTQNQDRFLGPELNLRKEILLRDKEKKEGRKKRKELALALAFSLASHLNNKFCLIWESWESQL